MPQIEVTVLSHLMIAGNGSGELGLHAATARRFEQGRWVPCIPATALRGAVRIRLEALLRGVGKRATGPYYPENGEDPADSKDVVYRLFGHSGPDGSRTGSKAGQLRFSDAMPRDPDAAADALQVRAGIEVDDFTGSVSKGKLFFHEVVESSSEPLVFEASLETAPDTSPKDLAVLRAALESTTEIGGGRARSGGEVQLRWLEGDSATERETASVVRGAPRAGGARLTLTLLEPAHFGDGGPRGNYHRTRGFIPGSTVRGAVAWALLRNGVDPDTPGFQALFVDPSTRASFGDALPVLEQEGELGGGGPKIRPATLRKTRNGDRRNDLLAQELARQRLNEVLEVSGRYLSPDLRSLRSDPEPPRPIEGLLLRTRTRLALDRSTGTAATGRLFSFEQVEAWLPETGVQEGTESRRTSFSTRVEGLTEETAQLLAQVVEAPVYVGAGRNHGQGRVRVEVCFEGEPEPSAEDLREQVARVLKLGKAVRRRAEEWAEELGLARADLAWDEDEVPLALVAQSTFVREEGKDHPLAYVDGISLSPHRALLQPDAFGGYDERPEKHRKGQESPLKPRLPAVGAGSVYVYTVERNQVASLLSRVLPALRKGVGRQRESGCGRFGLFEEVKK
ncbi:MAG: RAMP superfamily CRISPR-associated protein [Acidobacteriota bacterium]|nr:RAMP superfamily CRISPR-associated protein [Acidobacteriota bacterium]